MILESPKNSVIQEDIEELVNQFPHFKKFNDQTILVTGSTGLIGSQIVKTLACFNRLKHTHMTIIAHARNEKKQLIYLVI
ncbi:hypothetical protein P261_00973 [Lachnospiraceae bacterium TWA4]|nr:hypothetical protein P261_00973 [Lachnospiraceae bacterium TWA4]